MKSIINLQMKSIISFAHKDVEKYVNGVTRKIMMKSGASMMNTARKLIKSAPIGKASAPGAPFHSHNASGIKRSIQYALDTSKFGTSQNTAKSVARSVVIGPTFAQPLFQRHEKGGILRGKNKLRRVRRIGDAGVMAIGRTGRLRAERHVEIINPKNPDAGRTVPVTFARIRTQRQLDHVNRLEEELYGPTMIVAKYSERPVLKTALAKRRELEKDLRAEFVGQ